MGNCCKASSSMEWDGEDWECLKSSNQITKKPTKPYCSSSNRGKVFDESHLASQGNLCLDQNENKLLGKLRASCDSNGKVTLKISKCELAELLGAIQNNNHSINQQQQHMKKKQLASAEQVLFRLIKTRDHEIAKKHHNYYWKPILETIHECS